MTNYLKIWNDNGVTKFTPTVNKPVWSEVSATSDYYLDGLWYNSLGVVYNPQITYAKDISNSKLLGVEVVNGQPVYLHYVEDAPTLVLDSIKSIRILGNTINLSMLETADPLIDGEVWNSSGTLKISTGV